MTEIQADLDAINARAAPILADYSRLIKALNTGVTLILTIAAIGIFFAVAESHFETVDRINQEQISWAK
jgi:adenine/guanine phosphoribosyltransferase-like PRPP-binding protein